MLLWLLFSPGVLSWPEAGTHEPIPSLLFSRPLSWSAGSPPWTYSFFLFQPVAILISRLSSMILFLLSFSAGRYPDIAYRFVCFPVPLYLAGYLLSRDYFFPDWALLLYFPVKPLPFFWNCDKIRNKRHLPRIFNTIFLNFRHWSSCKFFIHHYLYSSKGLRLNLSEDRNPFFLLWSSAAQCCQLIRCP